MKITAMQFAEGLSDRQTVDAVRSRIGWKYGLSKLRPMKVRCGRKQNIKRW